CLHEQDEFSMKNKEEIKRFMIEFIEDVCERIGPRPPCSEQERKAAIHLKQVFESNGIDTQIENFKCHPGAYKATFRLIMMTVISFTLLYWIYFFVPSIPFLLASIIISGFGVLLIQTNLMRNMEFIDPIFPAKESENVLARIHPRSVPEKIVVIGGHHDSNWEFSIMRWSKTLFGIVMILPVLLNHLFLIIFIIKLFLYCFSQPYLLAAVIDLFFLVILSACIPFLVLGIFCLVSSRPVMGADDNLSALAVIMMLGIQFRKFTPLETTELWLVSHGCEEIGDRGSRTFVKNHHAELKDAFVINLDMIGNKNGEFRIDVAEEMGFLKLDEKLGMVLSRIAEKKAVQHSIGSIGAFTDSMAYAQMGIRACSLLSIPKSGFPAHYHTREDTIDKISSESLWKCYDLLKEFIQGIDNALFPEL
ncbi:MAG: M28 family metallopeptidase, partial [Candidatus Helarchaeales archaeon]